MQSLASSYVSFSCLTCVLFLASGCGNEGPKGSSCTVTKSDAGTGAVIRCDDGTQAVLQAPKSELSSCSVGSDASGAKKITCTDGTMLVARAEEGVLELHTRDGKHTM